MHPGDGAVFLDSSLDVHQHRMATTVTVENLFPRERYLHLPSGHHRKFADDNFVIKGIALATKATAVWSGDDANVAGGELQNLCQRAMYGVGRLRRTTECPFACRIEVADGGVLIQLQARASLGA